MVIFWGGGAKKWGSTLEAKSHFCLQCLWLARSHQNREFGQSQTLHRNGVWLPGQAWPTFLYITIHTKSAPLYYSTHPLCPQNWPQISLLCLYIILSLTASNQHSGYIFMKFPFHLVILAHINGVRSQLKYVAGTVSRALLPFARRWILSFFELKVAFKVGEDS